MWITGTKPPGTWRFNPPWKARDPSRFPYRLRTIIRISTNSVFKSKYVWPILQLGIKDWKPIWPTPMPTIPETPIASTISGTPSFEILTWAWMECSWLNRVIPTITKPTWKPYWISTDKKEPPIGLSRFCSEKAKKLLRNMPKSCSKLKKLLKKFC